MREERVHKLAEHLVAEIESIAHLETKGLKPEKVDGGQLVMKKMEENGKGDSKGEVKGGGGSPEKPPPCRFFTMEFGCKKGKQCGTRVTPRSVIGFGRRMEKEEEL